MTKRQQDIYDYIRTFITENHYSPSIREIAAAVGIKSSSTVHAHLEKMRVKGYIKFINSTSRTLQIVR